jgi:Spy/CpxP family protein refolding chaperone
MNRIPTIGLCVVLATGACTGRTAATAPTPDAAVEAAALAVEAPDSAASAAASSSAAAPPPARFRGLVGAFLRAAQDADLSDDQKTAIAKLEEPLQGDPGSHREMSALHADLVASVKEGKIDAAKIASDESAVAKVLSAREEEQASALSGLHDVLTPAQRGLVADAVRAARGRASPTAPPAGAADWAAHRLDRMKAQLVLDEDQQKQVAAVLARDAPTPAAIQAHSDAVKKQTEAIASAFERDTLDPKKLDLSPTPGKKPTDGIDRQIKYVAQLVPIFTPGQRDRFAALMEHPRDRGGRGDSITEAPDPGGGPGR